MGLFPSLEKLGSQKEPSKLDQIQPVIFHTVEYEIGGILRKIQDIENIDEKEIKDIIMRQHNMILNYDLFLANSDTRKQTQMLFTNKKFLKCFLDVVGTLVMTTHEKTCLNKLAYDYYILPEKDPEISELLFELTVWTNTREVAVLSGILGLQGARILAMIKNSSFKEERNVHRVNNFIVKCNIELTVQNVIDIFCGIFDRFTNVFIYSMIESKPEGLTQEESNRFDAISMSLIYILDSLSSYNIHKLIQDYSYTVSMLKSGTRVRFSLQGLNGYPRILSVVRQVELETDIRIP